MKKFYVALFIVAVMAEVLVNPALCDQKFETERSSNSIISKMNKQKKYMKGKFDTIDRYLKSIKGDIEKYSCKGLTYDQQED